MNYTNTLFLLRFAATELSTYFLWKTFELNKETENEMKKKNILNTAALTAAILLGFQARASVNAVEDRSEKFKCEIKTADEKNYLLDIGWSISVEAGEKPSTTKKIFFTLTNVDTNLIEKKEFIQRMYGDSTLYGRVDIEKEINSMSFTSFEQRCPRPGCYIKSFNAEFDVYRLTTLKTFEYSLTGNGYYVNEESIKLDIAQSQCELVIQHEK